MINIEAQTGDYICKLQSDNRNFRFDCIGNSNGNGNIEGGDDSATTEGEQGHGFPAGLEPIIERFK